MEAVSAMLLSGVREEIIRTCWEMSRRGLVQGTAGNVSYFDADADLLAVTPTSLPYDRMTAEDIVILDREGKLVEGSRKPTSECPLHCIIYKYRPDVRAVIHTHSSFATAISTLGVPVPAISVASLVAGGEIPVAPFAPLGSKELGEVVAKTLGDGCSVLLANHGVVAVGADLDEALSIAEFTEEAAKVFWIARVLGEPQRIPEAYVRKMCGRL